MTGPDDGVTDGHVDVAPGDADVAPDDAVPVRTATVETTHSDPATARVVAAAVAPDNTADVETTVDGATVRTVLRRETTGGLQSSVDDYVVNLATARTVVDAADAETRDTDEPYDAETDEAGAEVDPTATHDEAYSDDTGTEADTRTDAETATSGTARTTDTQTDTHDTDT